MFTADTLYGATDLPEWTTRLLLTPEVQRLRGIRLINSSSPSLAALSDARRYTHTLGVIRLALHCLPFQGVSVDDQRLSWPERELIRQIAEKLYGKKREAEHG